MYSFEGEFRRGPIQSFRGASTKECKEDLIKRAQEERLKREEFRIQNESAVKIQTLFRGYRTRKKEAMRLRELFDSKLSTFPKQSLVNIETVTDLCCQLLFFYDGSLDQSRLLWVCQQMLTQKDNVVNHMAENFEKMVHQMKLVLQLCLLYLEKLTSSQSLALPMRMLEIFTATETYVHLSVPKGKIWPPVVQNIFEFLCNKGYFKSLRILLNIKVPSRIERCHHPPIPIAESIFDLIMKPVNIAVASGDKGFCTSVLTEVCRELFCPSHSQQVELFLLPAMAYGKYPFPFVELIQALINKIGEKNETQLFSAKKNTNEDSSKKFSDANHWLLYAVLVLGEKYVETLTPQQTFQYLMLMQNLVPTLPLPRLQNFDDDDDEENDSDIEEMMVDDLETDFAYQEKLRESCLHYLDSIALARRIIVCTTEFPTPDILVAICNICHSLMCEQRIPVHKLRLLYTLAFNIDFMKRLWLECTCRYSISVSGTKISLIQILARGQSLAESDIQVIVPLLSVFCAAFSHSLHTLHDAEFYGDNEEKHFSISVEFKDERVKKSTSMPFSLNELVPMSLTLRDICLGIIELASPESKVFLNKDYQQAFSKTGIQVAKEENLLRTQLWRHLFKSISTLVKQLHSRDTRRQFCPTNHWLADHIHIRTDKLYNLQAANLYSQQPLMPYVPNDSGPDSGPPLSGRDIWNLIILTELPFVVRFTERIKILHQHVNQDREEHQSEMTNFQLGLSINIKIRRNYIYEDAFEKLSEENEPNLKLRLRVRLVNSAGIDEAGIDGGGLSREFLSELLKTGFDPNRGFFKYTNDKLLYPNPQAPALFENYTDHYYFLGRMLGKALYENLLVELPFAQFFLSKILNRHGIDLDIHHLASLDPEMYSPHLSYFVVHHQKIEELKPGGKDIQVTNYNRIEYIHLMADYKLNKQIRPHCHAFRLGLANVVNLEWLRMFDEHELQELISGANTPVNLEDLKQHTNYSGGFTAEHPVIEIFWKVVYDLTDQQLRQLLKFVTSCSRPPLLGFKDLYPVFCIHNAGTELERLPTASTCMNLLKLPEFYNEEAMRSKLLYAIESATGFELS
ncbi:ubiquitin-protein ligase E3C [Octopus bimaculoides]|uniref:ubiquitin-protein ligase E3C n=1 Tax=Octopus bimaculoides TaxID=37653 RepID=UPI00071DF701|nr:ubiquitin-protein ligase E3C [Octopus bimaculoides]|eukprot:XP_014775603.1 PREDICTED: ubiquitin-protein ligase E3C-like [Octopus bimaculoides]